MDVHRIEFSLILPLPFPRRLSLASILTLERGPELAQRLDQALDDGDVSLEVVPRC